MRAILSTLILLGLATAMFGCNERVAKAPPKKSALPLKVMPPVVDPIESISLEDMAQPVAGLPFELEPYVPPQ